MGREEKRIKRSYLHPILTLIPFENLQKVGYSKIPYLRKTEILKAPSGNQNQIILLDTIGELAKCYSIADIVFIGGSLVPVGGHNVLEASIFSKPVIFGKHMENFREVVDLIKEKKGEIQIKDMQELEEQALLLLNDSGLCRQIGETSLQVIKENSGAVKKSMVIINKILRSSISNKF